MQSKRKKEQKSKKVRHEESQNIEESEYNGKRSNKRSHKDSIEVNEDTLETKDNDNESMPRMQRFF